MRWIVSRRGIFGGESLPFFSFEKKSEIASFSV